MLLIFYKNLHVFRKKYILVTFFSFILLNFILQQWNWNVNFFSILVFSGQKCYSKNLIEYDKKCYFLRVSKDYYSLKEATNICENLNMTILEINSIEEKYFASSILFYSNQHSLFRSLTLSDLEVSTFHSNQL